LAIKHLRAKLGGFTIWVDAFCIKQEDTEEMSWQLPLMSDIHIKAETVFVWPENGNAGTERVMDYLGSGHPDLRH
jgi:hypothetical protein